MFFFIGDIFHGADKRKLDRDAKANIRKWGDMRTPVNLAAFSFLKPTCYRFNGFFILDQGEGMVRLPQYHFSQWLWRYFKAVFTESVVLKEAWQKDPVNCRIREDGDNRSACDGARLIQEATECYVLMHLATHLRDYFNKAGVSPDQLSVLDRDALLPLISSNRVLALISRPVEERGAYFDVEDQNNGSVMVLQRSGVMFEEFSLSLPKRSKIKRVAEGVLGIDTPQVKVEARVDFQALNEILPSSLERYVLPADSSGVGYKIDVEFSVANKWPSRLWSFQSRVHQWLVPFLQKFGQDFSQDEYLKRVNRDALDDRETCR